MNEIKEHMKVVGKDGGHVGTVDGVEGNRIKLTKDCDGQHQAQRAKFRFGHHV